MEGRGAERRKKRGAEDWDGEVKAEVTYNTTIYDTKDVFLFTVPSIGLSTPSMGSF